MDSVVSLVAALAWPVAVIWLAYLLRPEVRTLIDRIVSLKVPGAEAKFDKSLKEAEVEAAKMPPVLPPSPDKSEEVVSKLDQLHRVAAVSPRAAIMESWVMIETAAVAAGLTSGGARQQVIPGVIFDYLTNTGALAEESIQLVRKLRHLRNQAAHLPDFALTQEEAERYLNLAAMVTVLIGKVNKNK